MLAFVRDSKAVQGVSQPHDELKKGSGLAVIIGSCTGKQEVVNEK